MSDKFIVTEAAAQKIREISEKENKVGFGLRIRAYAGGCSGPQYQLGLDEKADKTDYTVESNGVKVFIDNDSLGFIEGASLDYIEGEMGSGFKVSNPNVPTSGGCGSGCGCGSGGGCGSGHGGHEHGGGHEEEGHGHGNGGCGCGSGCGCG